MNILLPLIVLFAFVLVGHSALHYERQPAVPGHENQCFDKETNTFYKRGEKMKWTEKGCGRKYCHGASGKDHTYVEIQTCGKANPGPGCTVEADLKLPYPDCCEKVVCPKKPATQGSKPK